MQDVTAVDQHRAHVDLVRQVAPIRFQPRQLLGEAPDAPASDRPLRRPDHRRRRVEVKPPPHTEVVSDLRGSVHGPPRRRSDARSAAIGPETTCHQEPLAAASRAAASSTARCSTSQANQLHQRAMAHMPRGPVWAMNAGSRVPQGPSAAYSNKSGDLPPAPAAAAAATLTRVVYSAVSATPITSQP